MGQLDKTDVEILQVLQKDAKVNTKELSEKLHISKTPIYERSNDSKMMVYKRICRFGG